MIKIKTYIILKKKKQPKLPKKFYCDGRFDEGLVNILLKKYSSKNDLVIDPFCGFGTVLKCSENLCRIPYGFEINYERYLYGLNKIQNKKNLINDNIINYKKYDLPLFDLCITSPTYSWKNMGYNPFNTSTKTNYYEEYLEDFKNYFKIISNMMKQGSYIIIDTSNINIDHVNTTLAWDVKQKLNEIEDIYFENELVICWKGLGDSFMGGEYGFGYDHSYCLIYKKINK